MIKASFASIVKIFHIFEFLAVGVRPDTKVLLVFELPTVTLEGYRVRIDKTKNMVKAAHSLFFWS